MLLDAIGRELAFTSSSKFTFTGGGNVGIGTSSHSYLLDVNGSSRVLNTFLVDSATTAELRLRGGGYGSSYNTSLRSITGAAGVLQFGNNDINYILAGNTAAGGYLSIRVNCASESVAAGSEAMRITNAGNVGIGTSTPAAKLDVNGTIQSYASTGNIRSYSTNAANDAIMFAGWTGDTGIEMRYNPNSAISYIQNTYPATSGQPFGDIHFRQSVSGTMTTRMIIKADGGNVGIGTSSPGSLLTLYATTTPTIAFQNSGAVRGYLSADSGNNIYNAVTGNGHVFQCDSTERMRIHAGGAVSIGSSTAVGRFLVQGATSNTADYTMILKNSSGTDLLVVRNDGYTFSPYTYNATTGGGANMHVASDGSLNRSVSSIKYKKNVKSYTKGLAEVLKMKPVTYNSINENETNTYAGLIAEEIHELGLTEFVQYADDETPDALSYSNMVALLVKSVQELKAEIDTLKNK